MPMLARLLAALAVAALSGCALGGTISEHSLAYNQTVEASTDTQLVLNVLRARDNAPMHFTTIGGIHGAVTLSAGLGYDLNSVNGSVAPALLASSQPSFDISPLDRQEFARGLIRPSDSALLRLLTDRGLPDAVLLHLLVSRFDAGPGGRRIHNDPALRHQLDPATHAACLAAGPAALPPCDAFEAAVDQLTRNGPIFVNGYTRLVPIGPPRTRAEAAAPELLASLRESGLTLRREGAQWRVFRAVNQLVLCLPGPPGPDGKVAYTTLAMDNEAPQVSPMSPAGEPCTANEVVDPSVAAGGASVPGLAWYLRSIDEVLHYLGDVQRREEQGVPYRVLLHRADGSSTSPRLFRLWAERPARPRMSLEYRGTRWWVAENDPDQDRTLGMLALTAQLLNLQKSAGEIPSASTLRLVR